MKFLLSLLLIILLSSCSRNASELKNPDVSQLAEQIPAHMRARTSGIKEEFPTISLPGDPPAKVSVNPEAQSSSTTVPLDPAASYLPALPDADDLVWTDPDNPDENLGSVEEVFTQPVKDPWQLSYKSAQRLSYAQGKPLMIWFTDSKKSPTCKSLGREVFGENEFEEWSDSKVVKLRVDTSPAESDRAIRSVKEKYAQALRKKFRVKGNPTVLIIGHDGQTVGRYIGYRAGQGDYYWGRIKNAVRTIDERHFDWRDRLEQKGYRMWNGKNGVKLFAKLLHYKEGKLIVSEPNGRKTRFSEKNLSKKDLAWIAKQKEMRAR